ncbi:hypothetical protein [Alteromonas gracilis]|uniref:hypothetical protein n=1 Tax=Alteromonas gracilis TaxID=1479524 RepID=UPI0030D15046
MKNVKNTLSALALMSMGALNTVSADTVSAGGIEWDTTDNNGNAGMSAQVSYQQWFTTGAYGYDALNDVFVINEDSNNGVTPGQGVLTGLGVFTVFSNGRSNTIPSFCADGFFSCELTFEFGGLVPQPNGTFDFSSGWLNVYFDNTVSLTNNVVTNPTDIFGAGADEDSYERFSSTQNGDLWASFDFDFFDFIPDDPADPFRAGFASAGLNVVGGIPEVVEAINFGDDLFDFFFTSETQINNQNYSQTATASITSVSSPATIGLMGLALFAVGGLSRKRK